MSRGEGGSGREEETTKNNSFGQGVMARNGGNFSRSCHLLSDKQGGRQVAGKLPDRSVVLVFPSRQFEIGQNGKES